MVLEYQRNVDEDCFDIIVKRFNNLINKIKRKLNNQSDIEDLEQELLLKIHKVILMFKFQNQVDNKYISEYLKIYQEFNEKDYVMFSNERQFVSYLEKALIRCYIDFKRKKPIENYIIDEIPDQSETKEEIKYTKSEKLLMEIIGNNQQKLTNEKIGQLLGISRQAVSKKKKKIFEKIKGKM
ncbi:MAG: sigma-70 family RNA polymerase sigma factor [Bacilli bacterium]|nr:sigma-70 family RNA polymerase sigma factor [Bacilli bacterium]